MTNDNPILRSLTMHIPTTRPACHTVTASPRPWKLSELLLASHPLSLHSECRAFRDSKQRQELNGAACDGCARIPKESTP